MANMAIFIKVLALGFGRKLRKKSGNPASVSS